MVLVLPSRGPLPQLCKREELTDLLLADPELSKATEALLSTSAQPSPAIVPDTCSVYVHQGEQASVTWGTQGCPGEVILGSQAATTCLIMSVRCAVTHRAYLVHHDRSTVALPTCQLTRYLDDMVQPEVYLVGSFQEASGESEFVLNTILRLLHEDCNQPMHVKLACVAGANTDTATGGYRAHGLWMQCSTGHVYPGDFPAPRAPDLPRRFAFASCNVIFANRLLSPLVTIADWNCPGHVLLPPVPVAYHWGYQRWLQQQLKLSDSELQLSSSTSPEFEPECFVSDLRASYEWQLQRMSECRQPGVEFLPAVCYQWVVRRTENRRVCGQWQRCDRVPSALEHLAVVGGDQDGDSDSDEGSEHSDALDVVGVGSAVETNGHRG